jgi:hypothetical protein
MRISEPDKPYFKFGRDFSDLMESYLKGDLESLPDTHQGQLAQSGLHYLPDPDPSLHVEHEIGGLLVPDQQITYIGYIDVACYVRDVEYLIGLGYDPDLYAILDHKTPKEDRWVKDARKLSIDTQMLLYAHWAFTEGPSREHDHIVVGHRSFVKTGPPRCVPTQVTLTRAHVEEAIQSRRQSAREIKRLTAVSDVNTVPDNRSACWEYGGCPHRAYCPVHNRTAAFFAGVEQISATPHEGRPMLNPTDAADVVIDVEPASNTVVDGTPLTTIPGLPTRAVNALVRAEITTIEQARALSKDDMRQIEGIGAGTLFKLWPLLHPPAEKRPEEPTTETRRTDERSESPMARLRRLGGLSKMRSHANPAVTTPAKQEAEPESDALSAVDRLRARRRASSAASAPPADKVETAMHIPVPEPEPDTVATVHAAVPDADVAEFTPYDAEAFGEAPEIASTTLYVGCAPRKGVDQDRVVLLEDLIAPYLDKFQSSTGLSHWSMVDFGKGVGVMVGLIAPDLAELVRGKTVIMSSFGNLNRALLDLLIPLADVVVQSTSG